ncbi:hypothetical protein [Nocardiopsis aegyptia]|uniref:Uncharacterized protein n=1 Tax=Nocardiopsis aegyptia TaxID=220378 RepID=A0A7Z0EML4_9ACTN|nr:hypothetical protein [Nocardiopsis aegyptia]NYJ34341.1 hypothetical protein [Nocardiopsis aegyptia]
MPHHHACALATRLTLLPGRWQDIRFDRRSDGATDVSALFGPAMADDVLYDLCVGVVLEGITPGTEVQIRAVEGASRGANGESVRRERPANSAVHATGHGRFTHAWKGALAPGEWMGVSVAQFGQADAHLTGAEAELLVWPRRPEG